MTERSTNLPDWVKILADNWRGRNGNSTTGDSVRNSCADELEKVAARHLTAEPQTAGLISREAADGIIEDMIYAWGIGKKYRESFKLDCERLLSSSVPRPKEK